MESGLVSPLQSWLSAKSEVVQIEDTDLVNVRTASSDGFNDMQHLQPNPKQELVQQLHAEPLLQLCNYSTYVDEIMAKCKQLHADAGLRIREKAAQLVAKLVDLDGGDRRMEVHPLLLPLTGEARWQYLLGLFLREIPSPKKLQRLHEGVEVGKARTRLRVLNLPIVFVERPEAEQELRRLKEEMRKTEVARDGIRRALEIDDEEFEQMRQKLEGEADSADCCLSREGTTALSWPTSTSSASSAGMLGREIRDAFYLVLAAVCCYPAAASTNFEAASPAVPDAATTDAVPASEAQLPDAKTSPTPLPSQQTDPSEAEASAEIGGQVHLAGQYPACLAGCPYLIGPAECPDRRWMLLADVEETIPHTTAAPPSQPVLPVAPVFGLLHVSGLRILMADGFSAPLTASQPADVPVKRREASSFKAGDRVTFARDSSRVADWSGIPAARLAFNEGQVETIHEVRGDWFCTEKWQKLRLHGSLNA
eukprot:s1119_g9.t1